MDSVAARLSQTKTLEEASEVITTSLSYRLARALSVPVEDIDINQPPFTFGVDSLVAVELMFWFSQEAKAEVPVVQIFGGNTIAQLGSIAAGMSGHLAALR